MGTRIAVSLLLAALAQSAWAQGVAPPAGGVNGVIPDGVYLAPVGGSLEVLQVLGARIASMPRVLMNSGNFNSANAGLVGSMVVSGNSLTVTWHDGKQRTGSFKFDGKCLSWGYIFCKATPFGAGDKLEGSYSGLLTAGGGVVSRSSVMTFGADGSYSMSATGAISAPAGTVGAASSTMSEQGRFEIDGWTLRLLRPASGPARELLAFPYEIYGRFDPIYLNGGLMRKRQ